LRKDDDEVLARQALDSLADRRTSDAGHGAERLLRVNEPGASRSVTIASSTSLQARSGSRAGGSSCVGAAARAPEL